MKPMSYFILFSLLTQLTLGFSRSAYADDKVVIPEAKKEEITTWGRLYRWSGLKLIHDAAPETGIPTLISGAAATVYGWGYLHLRKINQGVRQLETIRDQGVNEMRNGVSYDSPENRRKCFLTYQAISREMQAAENQFRAEFPTWTKKSPVISKEYNLGLGNSTEWKSRNGLDRDFKLDFDNIPPEIKKHISDKELEALKRREITPEQLSIQVVSRMETPVSNGPEIINEFEKYNRPTIQEQEASDFAREYGARFSEPVSYLIDGPIRKIFHIYQGRVEKLKENQWKGKKVLGYIMATPYKVPSATFIFIKDKTFNTKTGKKLYEFFAVTIPKNTVYPFLETWLGRKVSWVGRTTNFMLPYILSMGILLQGPMWGENAAKHEKVVEMQKVYNDFAANSNIEGEKTSQSLEEIKTQLELLRKGAREKIFSPFVQLLNLQSYRAAWNIAPGLGIDLTIPDREKEEIIYEALGKMVIKDPNNEQENHLKEMDQLFNDLYDKNLKEKDNDAKAVALETLLQQIITQSLDNRIQKEAAFRTKYDLAVKTYLDHNLSDKYLDLLVTNFKEKLSKIPDYAEKGMQAEIEKQKKEKESKEIK